MKRSIKIVIMILSFALVTALCSCSIFTYDKSRFEGGEPLDEELISRIESELSEKDELTEDTSSGMTVESEHESESESDVESGVTVYWTSNGTVWHTRRDCSYIKNSENIFSGTENDAISNGIKQLCSNCQKH